jgi:hypothetical protein
MSKTRTDVINLLFDKYKLQSYLEIGVRNPADNFNKIRAQQKHSVDPNPRRRYTFNLTSDEFFKRYNDKYDVIFVDGLHVAEQTYKDVKNSIEHLNSNGFIVIHDCNPPYESFTRSYEDFLKKPGAWNGTVYKAFIRLKYELKNWSCFVVNENFGCGILTERNILKNQLVEADINKITWDFFNKNRNGLLQLISFNEYCAI